ncbi:MAG: zinc ABC transporter substrate-binding protein [Chromatiales bacterium]|nr:zinc ABC transporter substrate-binding protein [Chromatiales bacterium]
MKTIRYFLLSLLLVTPSLLMAAPKVVVSTKPLHSLVTGLMDGVATPTLLANRQETLTESDKLTLITADMIIWVGPGFDKQLAQLTTHQLPGIQDNMFALSHHLPLLPKQGIDLTQVADPENRQAHRNLAFWMDPKLAAMAVRRMALKLSLLDPDNTEQYLNNEIKMVARIKALGDELSTILAPMTGEHRSIELGHDYLSWRFKLKPYEQDNLLAADLDAVHQCQNLMQVNNTNPPASAQDIYFEMMKQQANARVKCFPKPRTAENTEQRQRAAT